MEAEEDYTKFNSADFARKVSVYGAVCLNRIKESVAVIVNINFAMMADHMFSFISEAFLDLN